MCVDISSLVMKFSHVSDKLLVQMQDLRVKVHNLKTRNEFEACSIGHLIKFFKHLFFKP